ncbi:bifunctional diguanylate cyclase/phosphodiesterase [Marinobacter sp. 1_MG-2023]|uniref:putative bifunctional diguanylate cyclase/phosphodiesterase n=1 Tax=Marinobacter sp. 1_MG-2023 TaxID=3062627 RepID=UPI0026E11DB3|nr:EAL domain-containing response regulator [Marinobacter sp. 1_MG-2023]MDO6824226.1 EAL domain-containing protein [Marinobacter sp. 1_MG-2023]
MIVSDPYFESAGQLGEFTASGNKPKILVVDDEPTNIRALTDALSQEYDLVIATSVVEAMDTLKQGDRPHLILLDIMMPGTDGLQMCRNLKARHDLQHIPVIFVTARSDPESEEEGFEAGAVDYIHKPIRLTSVKARVRTHISMSGMLDHMITLNHDLKRRLEKLDNSRAPERNLFESVFMATSEGIVLLDANCKIVAVNVAFSRITGYARKEVLNRSYATMNSAPDPQLSLESLRSYMDKHDHWSGEIYNRRKSGELYPELRTISTIRSKNNEITHYVTVFNDISSLKETEQRLEELTWRDPITGLSNRALFLNQLGTVLKFCNHGKVSTAVLVVDINNFRYINETCGFKYGDKVIREFAKRLRDAVLSDDSIARLSGDEFGIVLAPKQWSIDDTYRVVLALYNHIQNCLTEPIIFEEGPELRLEVTIGAALYPTQSSDSPSSALQNAETAHRSAKADKRPIAIFEDSMSEKIRHQLQIESDINQALEQDQFVLYAQPQLSPERVLSGLEILIRWNHPERGLLGPGEFIPHAENSRQIVKIERWVLCKTLEKMNALHRTHPALRCAINISAKHFAEDDFVEAVGNALSISGFPPELLTLELTESVSADNLETVVQKMGAIRSLGCVFSLDDFGTGYSSLSRLQRLPISEVKIDRSFVLSALHETVAANIVEMVVRIGETMGVRVIAEGVETEAHANFLASRHPHVYLQGYYFGVPQPIDVVLNSARTP